MISRCTPLVVLYLAAFAVMQCGPESESRANPETRTPGPVAAPVLDSRVARLVRSARDQVGKTVRYDPSYVKLDYPGGDVALDRGVCTDVVVRAVRAAGMDLQELIHEDMRRNFRAYPDIWGLTRPDPNIDHRRVPNIATYLRRRGKAVPTTDRPGDYRPGDIVVWRLASGRMHIGILSDVRIRGGSRFQVVHNIGDGAVLEDVLFRYDITGHFRMFEAR